MYIYIYICPKTFGGGSLMVFMFQNLGGGFVDGFDGFLPVLAFFPLLRVL